MPKPKRRIMRKFSIRELSGVDVPAQAGARALIMKRDDGAPAERVNKDDVVQAITGTNEGHLHGIHIYTSDRGVRLSTTYAMVEGAESGHDHMLFRDTAGTYTVLENAGHTHALDNAALNAAIAASVQKAQPQETDMTPEEKAELEKLQKASERLGKIVALNAEARKHFDGLGGDEAKDAFLAKDDAGQKAEIAKAEEVRKAEEARKNAEDPVVHTTAEGVEIRKSDGATVLALVKSNEALVQKVDSLSGDLAKATAATEVATFEKRAESELAHLPGKVSERAALLKAAEGIEDEDTRKAAVAALHAQNAALKPAFESYGYHGTADDIAKGEDPQAKLDELTKAHQKDHSDLTFEAAQAEVLKTAEGKAIFDQILAAEDTDRRAAH